MFPSKQILVLFCYQSNFKRPAIPFIYSQPQDGEHTFKFSDPTLGSSQLRLAHGHCRVHNAEVTEKHLMVFLQVLTFLVCFCSRELDLSRARTMDQVQKVIRVESPSCLAIGKTGKTRTLPPG